jgi:hypothetical protein
MADRRFGERNNWAGSQDCRRHARRKPDEEGKDNRRGPDQSRTDFGDVTALGCFIL